MRNEWKIENLISPEVENEENEVQLDEEIEDVEDSEVEEENGDELQLEACEQDEWLVEDERQLELQL